METLKKNTTHGNAEKLEQSKQNSSDEKQLFQQIKIEDTPFTAVKMGEEQWFLTMGKYRLSENLKSLEECIENSKDASWWRIMAVVNIMIKENETDQKYEKAIDNAIKNMDDLDEQECTDRLRNLAEERMKDRKKFEQNN